MLYPRKERDRIDALCRRLRESGEVCWVSNEADPNGGVRSIARPGVRLMTIHAAKGLEFPAVIVSAVDQLPSPIEPDEVRDGNLLYVGLTRAMDHLAVTWAGRSDFTDRVLRSNKGRCFLNSVNDEKDRNANSERRSSRLLPRAAGDRGRKRPHT